MTDRDPGFVQPTGETLAGVGVFRRLLPAEREEIASMLHGRHYAPGQTVVSHHDEGRDVYFIVSGNVRVTVYSRSGRQVSFRDQGPGEMFGEIAAIDGAPRSAHVIALDDALILSIHPDALWTVISSYPEVNRFILLRLTRLVRLLSERVVEQTTMAVSQRVHCELLRLAIAARGPDDSALIRPAPTHAEIASRVGTHREAVTREFRRLQKAGMVERQGRALRVPVVSALAELVEGEREG